jgi:hypothetical protein
VRASATDNGLKEIEKAVGSVNKGKMTGTGFVVESGAPETRDFEVIVLNAHTYYDDDCRRKAGPFRFLANTKLKPDPFVLHLYRVGTKCPYKELDKDWAVGIIYGRLRKATPIQYRYLRDDEIRSMNYGGISFNIVGHNVRKQRIDSINLAKAECRPFLVPNYWVQSRKHGLGVNNLFHNCPTRAGISGGPLIGKGKNNDGTDFHIALGIHSGEFYSLREADPFEITYNANVAVRFGRELRSAVREAGRLNSFAEFQAEMRRRKWLVTSARYSMEL